MVISCCILHFSYHHKLVALHRWVFLFFCVLFLCRFSLNIIMVMILHVFSWSSFVADRLLLRCVVSWILAGGRAADRQGRPEARRA